jgi:transposase
MRATLNCQTREVVWTKTNEDLKREVRDAIVYEWVRFEGKTQLWAAAEMGISQGTVSRILERVERRAAHAPEGTGGRLDPQERQRVQRWLTYERNERMLSSCLRIAHEVEGFIDVTKSTTERNGLASVEQEIRTVHSTLDRSATAARFLRLAFRINMEQLKLVEMEPLELLAPLTAEEQAELDRDEEDAGGDVQAPECGVKLAELEDESAASTDPHPAFGHPLPEGEGVTAAALAEATPDANSHPAFGHPHPRGEGVTAASCENGYAHGAHRRIPKESGASADAAGSCEPFGPVPKNRPESRMATIGSMVG